MIVVAFPANMGLLLCNTLHGRAKDFPLSRWNIIR